MKNQITGKIPLLLQDECRGLALWFSSRMGARYQVQLMFKNFKENNMTDKILIDKAVLQQAIDAFAFAYNESDSDWVRDEKIIPADTALREALAAPVAGIPAALTPSELADRIEHGEKWEAQPAQELLTCDICGAETQDPWHYSEADQRHLHACDKCWAAHQPAHGIGETK